MASSTIKRLGAGGLMAAAGAAVAYLFDPDNGNRRRAVASDRIAAFFRQGARNTAGTAQATATRVRDHAAGAVHGARKVAEPERPAPNDHELAHRVETEIFRSPEIPKGSVNVNAEVGIVYLRGEVKSDDQREYLIEGARKVDGVRAVEDLLHLPGEEPRTKHETEDETRLRVEAARRT